MPDDNRLTLERLATTRRTSRRRTGTTGYSRIIKGDRTNHGQNVRFDLTDGYIGISQLDEGHRLVDRVLLTPAQYRALRAFIERAEVER